MSSRSCEHSTQECVSCRKARWRSANTSLQATPTRKRTAGAPPAGPQNSWEKGVPKDDRGVPYLDEKGGIVYQKEFSENRRRWRNAQRDSIQVNSGE